MQYDVFLSYCHDDSTDLASALETALETLGRRWDQPKALEVFRDVSDQAATPGLAGDLRRRLDATAHFLLDEQLDPERIGDGLFI